MDSKEIIPSSAFVRTEEFIENASVDTCPFCGKDPEVWRGFEMPNIWGNRNEKVRPYQINCKLESGCLVRPGVWHISLEEAENMWNVRKGY